LDIFRSFPESAAGRCPCSTAATFRAQDEIGRQDLKRKLLGHNQDDLSATWHADGALSGAVDRLRRPCSEWSEVSLEHSLCTPMKEDQTYRG
jgi:hypothetical protein